MPHARPPWQLAAHLDAPGLHALDAGPEGWGTALGGSGAPASLLACGPEELFAGGLEALEEARLWLEDWRGPEPEAALLLGAFSYELGREFERLPSSTAPEPVDALPPVRLAAFRAVYRYRLDGTGEIVGSDPAAVAELFDRVRGAAEAAGTARTAAPRLPAPQARTTDADYCAAVERIQDWIRAGDVYQVNLSRRLDLAPVEPAELPRR